MTRKAFLFPGQGAQYTGMGKDFFEQYEEARDVYRRAGEVLGFNIAEVCFNGKETDLSRTPISQPAILTTGIAILEVFKSTKGADAAACYAACGHSLGEYTALVFAGAINLEDAVELVYKRGRYMQEAADGAPGGMVAILRLEDKDVEAVCREASRYGTVCPANYNSPGQVVISGENRALEAAAELAREKGAKTMTLKVSGGFHSPLMDSARSKLSQELEKVRLNRAAVPVVCNVNAEYVREPEEIRNALAAQVTSPVRWRQSIENLIRDGVDEFYEVGPGRVLSGLLRRIDPDRRAKNIETVRSLDDVLSR